MTIGAGSVTCMGDGCSSEAARVVDGGSSASLLASNGLLSLIWGAWLLFRYRSAISSAQSYTCCLFLSMSPAVGSSHFVLRVMQPDLSKDTTMACKYAWMLIKINHR